MAKKGKARIGYNTEKRRAVRAYTYKYGTPAQKTKLLSTAAKRFNKHIKKSK